MKTATLITVPPAVIDNIQLGISVIDSVTLITASALTVALVWLFGSSANEALGAPVAGLSALPTNKGFSKNIDMIYSDGKFGVSAGVEQKIPSTPLKVEGSVAARSDVSGSARLTVHNDKIGVSIGASISKNGIQPEAKIVVFTSDNNPGTDNQLGSSSSTNPNEYVNSNGETVVTSYSPGMGATAVKERTATIGIGVVSAPEGTSRIVEFVRSVKPTGIPSIPDGKPIVKPFTRPVEPKIKPLVKPQIEKVKPEPTVQIPEVKAEPVKRIVRGVSKIVEFRQRMDGDSGTPPKQELTDNRRKRPDEESWDGFYPVEIRHKTRTVFLRSS